MSIREITSADSESYYRLRVLSEEEYPEFVGFNAERELSAGPWGIAELLSKYPTGGTLVFGDFSGSSLSPVGNEISGFAKLHRFLEFRLSPCPKHYPWCLTTMPSADFCLITHSISVLGAIVLRHFFLVTYDASVIEPIY